MSMKNFHDTIGNRNHELQTCSAVLTNLDNILIFNGKWLLILLPESKTPFCINVKFVEGKCKLCLKCLFLS